MGDMSMQNQAVLGATDTDSYVHTVYPEQLLRYVVTMGEVETCVHRRSGGHPKVDWADAGHRYRSYGSPLIVGCCSED